MIARKYGCERYEISNANALKHRRTVEQKKTHKFDFCYDVTNIPTVLMFTRTVALSNHLYEKLTT